jgi:hypothetical protein
MPLWTFTERLAADGSETSVRKENVRLTKHIVPRGQAGMHVALNVHLLRSCMLIISSESAAGWRTKVCVHRIIPKEDQCVRETSLHRGAHGVRIQRQVRSRSCMAYFEGSDT